MVWHVSHDPLLHEIVTTWFYICVFAYRYVDKPVLGLDNQEAKIILIKKQKYLGFFLLQCDKNQIGINLKSKNCIMVYNTRESNPVTLYQTKFEFPKYL